MGFKTLAFIVLISSFHYLKTMNFYQPFLNVAALDSTLENEKRMIEILESFLKDKNKEEIKAIIDRKAPFYSNGDVTFETTILHIAVIKNYEKLVKWLLHLGAYPNIRDCWKAMPLHYACLYNYLNIIEIFLTTTVNSDICSRYIYYDSKDNVCESTQSIGSVIIDLFEKANKGEKIKSILNDYWETRAALTQINTLDINSEKNKEI